MSEVAMRGLAGTAVAAAMLLACTDHTVSSAIPARSPSATISAASATRGQAREQPPPIESMYVHDVWVVPVPPLAIHLLARFGESGADCEEALLRHARGLGANRLYIDPSGTCRGAAYFVPPHAEADDGASTEPLWHGAGHVAPLNPGSYGATLHDWMRARWRRPASLSESDVKRLCVVVQFSTTEQLRIWNVRGQPILSSGNADFDESVRAALESAIDAHVALPEPPSLGESRRMRRAQVRFAFSEGTIEGCR